MHVFLYTAIARVAVAIAVALHVFVEIATSGISATKTAVATDALATEALRLPQSTD